MKAKKGQDISVSARTTRTRHPVHRTATPWALAEEDEAARASGLPQGASSLFPSIAHKMIVTEIAATLAFSAIQNNDKVGVIFFSNKIEKFIPPKKGTTHILHIIRELVNFEPENCGTDISGALRYFTNVIKKRSTAFLISDFYDRDFEYAIKIASKKHDLVTLRMTDRNEEQLPDWGLVNFFDPETNRNIWLDTSSKEIRDTFSRNYREHEESVHTLFRKYGIDSAEISTDEDYVKSLMRLFKMRGQKV